jgi:hypothetical protein
VNFIHRDGENLKEDVKGLYQDLLDNEKGKSVRFVMGHYLAGFFFRDRAWMSERFDQLFCNHQEDDFTPAWEGYVAGNLYIGLFRELRAYYKKAINISSESYPQNRRFIKDPDESLAVHLALAYVHFDDVDWSDELIQVLFKGGDIKKQKEFISYIGRGIISKSGSSKEWMKENNIDPAQIKELWEKVLEEELSPEVYAGFGFWYAFSHDIYNDKQWLVRKTQETLEKSQGALNWDHGLKTNLREYAETDAEATLNILRACLLDANVENPHEAFGWWSIDQEEIEIFKILYKKKPEEIFKILYKKKPEETKDLISRLVSNQIFWPLEKIVK